MTKPSSRARNFQAILRAIGLDPPGFAQIANVPRQTAIRLADGESWSSKPLWEHLSRTLGVTEDYLRTAVDGEVTPMDVARALRPAIDRRRAEIERRRFVRRAIRAASDEMEEDGSLVPDGVRAVVEDVIMRHYPEGPPDQGAIKLLIADAARAVDEFAARLERFNPPSGTIPRAL